MGGKVYSSTGVTHMIFNVIMDQVEKVVFHFRLEDDQVGVHSCSIQLSESRVLEKMEPFLANKPTAKYDFEG